MRVFPALPAAIQHFALTAFRDAMAEGMEVPEAVKAASEACAADAERQGVPAEGVETIREVLTEWLAVVAVDILLEIMAEALIEEMLSPEEV